MTINNVHVVDDTFRDKKPRIRRILYYRNCPTCGREMRYYTLLGALRSESEGVGCKRCRVRSSHGKHLREKTDFDEKVSNGFGLIDQEEHVGDSHMPLEYNYITAFDYADLVDAINAGKNYVAEISGRYKELVMEAFNSRPKVTWHVVKGSETKYNIGRFKIRQYERREKVITLEYDITKIDWELLRQQKLRLVALASVVGEEDKSAIDGVVHLIDDIQDQVVASKVVSEDTVFGKRG